MRGLLAALVAALAAAACTASPTTDAEPVTSPASTEQVEPTMQPSDVVDLTVYFRSGEGSGAHLVPVTREAAIDDDLPRRALELLIAGPGDDDGRSLDPPLPAGTQVRDVTVTDGTAVVDLSHEVISRAGDVNPSPEHEALALAAVVGTLTEFPAIERVRLLVEGHQRGVHGGVDVGAFWGGWGLPELLVRDESVFSQPAEGEGVPDLQSFETGNQTLGAAPDDPLAVTSVRIRDRTTYLRVVVELAVVDDPDVAAAVPPTRARMLGGNVVLEIEDVADYDADFAPGQRVELDDPMFEGVTVEETERDGRVRIVVLPREERPFWLHDLSSPTRIVLDVRK